MIDIVINFFLFFVILVSLYLGKKLSWQHYFNIKKGFSILFSPFSRTKDPGKIMHFQALLLSLGGTIGVGNITGVVIAVTLGGPGAIFWIWVSALLGMTLKFASVLIMVKFREIKKDHSILGGVMYIYRDQLGLAWAGNFTAFLLLFIAIYTGNFIQSEAILKGLNFIIPEFESFDIYIIAFFLSIAVGFVIFENIEKRIKMLSLIVPIMLIFYIASCLWIIFIHIDKIFSMIYLIFSKAFSLESISSGFLGSFFILSFKEGLLRGFFSNEATFGSSSMAYILVKDRKINRQALVSMLEIIIDSFIICSLTAFVLILTDTWDMQSLEHPFKIMSYAFQKGFSIFFEEEAVFFSSIIVGISIILFAYSTIITWSYYGEQAILYFFNVDKKYVIYMYKFCYTFITFLGAIFHLDTLNHLFYYLSFVIAVPHLLVLILFISKVEKETFNFFKSNNKSKYKEDNVEND